MFILGGSFQYRYHTGSERTSDVVVYVVADEKDVGAGNVYLFGGFEEDAFVGLAKRIIIRIYLDIEKMEEPEFIEVLFE